MSAPRHRFTMRQRQVLEGVARGETYHEIADGLGIGYATVRTYVLQVHAAIGYPHLPPKAALCQFVMDSQDAA